MIYKNVTYYPKVQDLLITSVKRGRGSPAGHMPLLMIRTQHVRLLLFRCHRVVDMERFFAEEWRFAEGEIT